MRSVWEFFAVAIVVTITPGPGTTTVLRVAARDGRRAATQAILGNSAGVLTWGALSAVGVSSLILASQRRTTSSASGVRLYSSRSDSAHCLDATPRPSSG
ncbi:MAG TPA: LysE family transporter, partial [Candidatus Tumulicola sp.]|nr:LysE family transporter [Candidatus Tumulicola sp.]